MARQQAPSAITLRGYQRRICDEVEGRNSLVILPTGAGKTLLAAEVIRRHLDSRGPGNGKAVFLVPACFLVEQQAEPLQSWLGSSAGSLTRFRVAQYMGGLAFPEQGFDVLVSTPAAFQAAQKRRPQLAWGSTEISMVVFDEVHHVLKDHPYRKIAMSLLRGGASADQVVVLGLSASLTYAVAEAAVQTAMQRLSRELRVQCMATATPEELARDGFRGGGSSLAAEVRDEIQLPTRALSERQRTLPEEQRKPHLMHPTFWSRIRAGEATEFAARLVHAIRSLESAAAAHQMAPSSSFASPLTSQKLASWGQYAHHRAREARCRVCSQLQHWYEALRLVVLCWEEVDGQELALLYLRMMQQHPQSQFNGEAVRTTEVESFCRFYGLEASRADASVDAAAEEDLYPKWAHLWHELLRQRELKAQQGRRLRAVVFVQQKTTAHILSHFINRGRLAPSSDEGGSSGLPEKPFIAVPLHSTTTEAPTPLLGLSKGEADANLHRFSSGAADVMVSTTVAEEGMDVQGANCVIRFDPVLTGVSFVQGRGRARQEDSSFVILAQRGDRPAARLAESEAVQARLASAFDPAAVARDAGAKEEAAQRSRERGAHSVLQKTSASALADLNLFCKKTKAELAQEDGRSAGGNSHVCDLSYTSCLRQLSGRGEAPLKAEAKKVAAEVLLGKLRADLLGD